MIPVVGPSEMAAIDAAAPEPTTVLVERAGAAVARVALSMLGGSYGRRVVVVEGKGNNGADGRSAARRLRSAGVRVAELEVASLPDRLPEADLVIDAAFGTGFRGEHRAPLLGSRPGGGGIPEVLAVDIPSGVDGATGEAAGRVLRADRTVTFAALKPGLLLQPGADLAGRVTLADIGLDTSSATVHLLEAADVAALLPVRPPEAHKWQTALCAVAGSPGMSGAAALCAGGAQRAGAGYVRLCTPGGLPTGVPEEVVQVVLPGEGWAGPVLGDLGRFSALVIGNGLGTGAGTESEVRSVVGSATLPTVVDADGLTALGVDAARIVASRGGGTEPTVVLTPHDGELARLIGGPGPGPDRIGAARALAAHVGAVVLLKGSLTTVAHPDGRVLLSATGDSRLATAGTGDVLAGVVGAFCAGGLDVWRAAACGAFVHGLAGAVGFRRGLVAGDLLSTLPLVLEELTDG